jgi:hypothetical protein
MSQTGDFHWLINNLLWQLIYKASGFGFLPKQLFTAAFIKNPARACPTSAMLFVVWFVRLEIDLKESCVLLSTCIGGALVWSLDQGYQRTHEGTNYTDLCIAPPNGL